jgi:hypothetical protein
MKRKVNVEELEARIDFASVSSRLEKLSENGQLKRRKTVADLLDKVKPALLKAREKRVTFAVLTEFLRENGISVSEPTLRQYLRAQEGAPSERKLKRRKAVKRSASTPENGAVEETKVASEPEPKVEPSSVKNDEKKKLPPRLARRGG